MPSWPWVIVAGYFIGAIPTGVILGRLGRGLDVRDYGSGKMGATNVFRVAGARLGLVVFALDLAKGAAIGLGALGLTSMLGVAVAAVAVGVVGHNFPIYLCFRGGRGVLTYFGGLFAFAWPVALGGGLLALGLIALTRYASLGSVLGIIATILPLALLVGLGLQPEEVLLYSLVAGGFVIFQHRDNIYRLFRGTERKVIEGRRPQP